VSDELSPEIRETLFDLAKTEFGSRIRLDVLTDSIRNLIAKDGVERTAAEASVFFTERAREDPARVGILLASTLIERAQVTALREAANREEDHDT